MSRCICLVGLWLFVTAAAGCAAHRTDMPDGQDDVAEDSADRYETASEAMAEEQASEATASIGDQHQIQNEARQAAAVLKGLVALVLRLPNAKPEVVSGLTRDLAQLSSGLDAIADSRNATEFTAAVFGMCEPEPVQASSRVGPLLIAFGARIRSNPPAKVPGDQVTAWAQYLDSLGETFVRIPQQCRHAQKLIAQEDAKAKAEEQAAKIEAEKRHQASMLLLCIAGGMLSPNPNRYPMSAPIKIGYALQQCQ
jgi:hypothetical protein